MGLSKVVLLEEMVNQANVQFPPFPMFILINEVVDLFIKGIVSAHNDVLFIA